MLMSAGNGNTGALIIRIGFWGHSELKTVFRNSEEHDR